MKTSDEGVRLIEKFEGFSPKMYMDPVGLPTIGFGTLLDTKEEQYLKTATISRIEAEVLLRKELYPIEAALNKMVRVPINQNQFDALVSFCYNLGTGALKTSTLLQKINQNPADPDIAGEFAKWHHAGGKDLPGLKARRLEESRLYFS